MLIDTERIAAVVFVVLLILSGVTLPIWDDLKKAGCGLRVIVSAGQWTCEKPTHPPQTGVE